MSDRRDVPLWTCEDEWQLVYSWLYSDDYEVAKKGCARVQAWKARSTRPSIPFPIESTSELVDCRIAEANVVSNQSVLQQCYAMAITRFVNGVYELRYERCKLKEPVFTALKEMRVPSWIVTARHSATHASMPSLTILKAAVEFALKWLRENYWEKQVMLISVAKEHSSSDVPNSGMCRVREMLKKHWNNLTKGTSVGGSRKRLPKVVDEVALKLASLSKRELTELICDGLLLVPSASQAPILTEYFHLEEPAEDQVESFPVLPDNLAFMWSRPLELIHQHNPLCMSTIISVLAEQVHNDTVSQPVSTHMAAWLGRLLSDQYYELTTSVSWLELLATCYDNPGAYSYAIMTRVGVRLSENNHPFVLSEQFSLFLECTKLLSEAERILPSIKPLGSYVFTSQDDYAAKVDKLVKESNGRKRPHPEDSITNPWKKSNVLVDWTCIPLGLAPGQKLTTNFLDLPDDLNDEAATDTIHNGSLSSHLSPTVNNTLQLKTTTTKRKHFDKKDLTKIRECLDNDAKI